MKTWNERVAAKRKEIGLSQAAFARAVGVKPPTVFEWEEGITKKLKSDSLLAVARVLKCSPEWINTGRGDEQVETPPESDRPALHEHDYDLVSAYRNLPIDMQTAVWDIIDGYLRRHVEGYAMAVGVRDVARAVKGDGARKSRAAPAKSR